MDRRNRGIEQGRILHFVRNRPSHLLHNAHHSRPHRHVRHILVPRFLRIPVEISISQALLLLMPSSPFQSHVTSPIRLRRPVRPARPPPDDFISLSSPSHHHRHLSNHHPNSNRIAISVVPVYIVVEVQCSPCARGQGSVSSCCLGP